MLWQPIWFLVRRLILAVVVVHFDQTFIWQLSLIVLQLIVSVIIYGNVEPLKGRRANQIELFNEVSIMFVIYNMVCFTPFVPDIEVRHNLGFFVCALVTINILVNFSGIIIVPFRSLQFMRKSRKARKEYFPKRDALKKKWDERKVIRTEKRKVRREAIKKKREREEAGLVDESSEQNISGVCEII